MPLLSLCEGKWPRRGGSRSVGAVVVQAWLEELVMKCGSVAEKRETDLTASDDVGEDEEEERGRRWSQGGVGERGIGLREQEGLVWLGDAEGGGGSEGGVYLLRFYV